MSLVITKPDGSITVTSTHGGQRPDTPARGLCYGTWNWYKLNDEEWVRWEGPSMCGFRRAAELANSVKEFKHTISLYNEGNYYLI